MRLGLTLISALIFAMSVFTTRPAQAQDFSIEAYLEVQEAADNAYEAMLAIDPSDPGFSDAAGLALIRRTAAVGYLSDWLRSGSMPSSMVSNARETRIVLYQNIVRIYSDLGQCDDARSTLNTMDRILDGDSGATEIAYDALLEARTTTTTCGLGVSATANETVPDPVEVAAEPPQAEVSESADTAELVVEAQGEEPVVEAQGEEPVVEAQGEESVVEAQGEESQQSSTVEAPPASVAATPSAEAATPPGLAYAEHERLRKRRNLGYGLIGGGVFAWLVSAGVGGSEECTSDGQGGETCVGGNQDAAAAWGLLGAALTGTGIYFIYPAAHPSDGDSGGGGITVGGLELSPYVSPRALGVRGRF